MRRLAAIQIDEMLKDRLAKLKLDSANIQLEMALHGCITDAARDFLLKLPKVESMIPPIKVSEVEALIEGNIVPGQRPTDLLDDTQKPTPLDNAQKQIQD